LLFALGNPVAADTVTAVVTYISAAGFYLDTGREQGLRDSLKGILQRNSEDIAQVEILSLSDHTARCRILAADIPALPGDTVLFSIDRAPVPESPIPAPKLLESPKEKSVPPAPVRHVRVADISGRIGIQTYAQDDRTKLNYDFYQPALAIRFKAASLFDSHYAFSVRLRSRRIYRSTDNHREKPQAWDNRVYEMSLSYENPRSPLNFQLGRIMARRISGIGYLDGIFGEFDVSRYFSVGSFGGTQPDLRTTNIQAQTRKTGLFAAWHSPDSAPTNFSLTGALAGDYTSGHINREFFYQQSSLTHRSQLAVFQSAEININRGWKKQAENRTLTLANLLFNLRYTPARFAAFVVGYDGYANYRTWESRETPDSLFDEAMRRGYHAGIEVKLPWGFRSDLRGTLRDDTPDHLYRSGSFAVRTHRILRGRVGAGARHNVFQSRFTDGKQSSAEVSVVTRRGSELRIQVGRMVYDYHNNRPPTINDWWRASVDVAIGRRYYGSAYFESYHGTNEDSSRLFFETGVRL